MRVSCNQLDSAVLNAYLWTESKRNLPPLDVFFWALLCPKCICGRGSTPDPARGAYSNPPGLVAGGEGARWARCLLPKNPTPDLGPSGFELWPFGPSVPIVTVLRNDHSASPGVSGGSLRLALALGCRSQEFFELCFFFFFYFQCIATNPSDYTHCVFLSLRRR